MHVARGKVRRKGATVDLHGTGVHRCAQLTHAMMLNEPTFAPLANFCTAEALIVECGLVSVTSLRWEGKRRANSRVMS